MRWWLLLVVALGGCGWGVRSASNGRLLAQTRSPWREVSPGVEMRSFQWDDGGYKARVVAFRAAPSRVRVAEGVPTGAAGWRSRENAVLAVNGGFFDAETRSLGLRICDGRRTSPLHGRKWGVFRVKRGQARIVEAPEFADALRRKLRYEQAVQCGPVLVRGGRVGDFKAQWARRTGLGIQSDGRVVVAVSDGSLSMAGWARCFSQGLACPDALNLDGGSSTQLSLRAARAQMEIGSLRTVPDAILIR
jgi:exopolysaccharide biosynthesis protein